MLGRDCLCFCQATRQLVECLLGKDAHIPCEWQDGTGTYVLRVPSVAHTCAKGVCATFIGSKARLRPNLHPSPSQTRTHAIMCPPPPPHTHTYTHLHTRTCTHTHAHTHKHSHKHSQTHTYTQGTSWAVCLPAPQPTSCSPLAATRSPLPAVNPAAQPPSLKA